jgi:beta-glucosidase
MTGSAAEHADLIARLDLPAKVRLLSGAGPFNLAAEESIGLAELRVSDGPTGVRGLKFSGGPKVALLPNASLLAQSWSAEVLGEIGAILAEEAMAQRIHVVLGPTVNLHRSPLGGRLFEAFSEDPLLTGRLAAGYVRGLQALGVGACLKHLVANESETLRNTMDSVVDEATLRELYLLPFELSVTDGTGGGAWTMMAAYNDVNGVPATEQAHVNTEIVKQEWGFDGLIMSDWFATKRTAEPANGGLDLVMPGPVGPWGEALVNAVKSGEVAEGVVDEHLTRVLRLAERVGVLGAPRPYPADLPAPDSPRRREQLTRLAAGAITVLTNRQANQERKDGGAVLPLPPGVRVALIGRHAVETVDMGGGSAAVNPPYQVSVAEGFRSRPVEVTVVDGVEVRTRPVAARAEAVADPETGEPGMRVLLHGRDGALIESRHHPLGSVMVGFDDDFDAAVARVVLRAVVHPGGAEAEDYEVGALGSGDWTLTHGDRTETFSLRSAGQGFGEDALTPPGQSFTVRLTGDRVVEVEAHKPLPPEGTPSTGSPFSDGVAGLYGLIARPPQRPSAVALAEAVAAAQDADVAVVVVGLTEEQETEAVDKSTLRLPGDQDALVTAVAGVARRSVVVVNAATPVLMPWVDEVDAVLWAGLPGQEGGHAIAAALLGEIEPSGRLVTSFPVSDGAAPAWSVTPDGLRLEYTEGTAIGYRGYHAGRAPEPLFWFGHGLGYTSWQYDDAEVVAASGAGTPGVRVRVTNTGARTGREVVQVYFDPAGTDRPIRLAGWAEVTLAAGGSAVVEVGTEPRMWRRWDTGRSRWSVLPGAGRLVVARGLGDVRAALDLG